MEHKEEKQISKCCEKCIGSAYFNHRIGSHSDDYGGTSDEPCYCNKDDCWGKCECHIPQPPESKEECKHIFDWGKYMDSCVCRFCKLFLSSDEYIELKNRELLKKGIFTQCESCLTRKHIDCCSDGCQCSCKIAIKNPSESLEEKGEMKLEDCQVCEQYICKCPVKEFTPPTDSKLNQEYNNK